MDTIKFPIRFGSGGLELLRDGSEDYYAQLLTVALLTEPRSHPYSPLFGVNDPSFTSVDRGLFILNAARFVPEVEITSVSTNAKNDGTTGVSFSFVITEG